MPHGGRDDADVEGVYMQFDNIIMKARRSLRDCVLTGHWNAVVGEGQT